MEKISRNFRKNLKISFEITQQFVKTFKKMLRNVIKICKKDQRIEEILKKYFLFR